MDDKVTNLTRYYLISYPSSSAFFNHPTEIAMNSFLFVMIWGISFIHRVYSAPTHQDLAASARDSVSSYHMTWACARYVQSHPKSVGMAYFPERILNIATLDKRCYMHHIRQRGFFPSSFYIRKINDVLFFRLLSYFHDIMFTQSV